MDTCELQTIEISTIRFAHIDTTTIRHGMIGIVDAGGMICEIGDTEEEARKNAKMRQFTTKVASGFTWKGEAVRLVLTERQLERVRTEWRIRRAGDGFMAVHPALDYTKAFVTRREAEAYITDMAAQYDQQLSEAFGLLRRSSDAVLQDKIRIFRGNHNFVSLQFLYWAEPLLAARKATGKRIDVVTIDGLQKVREDTNSKATQLLEPSPAADAHAFIVSLAKGR